MRRTTIESQRGRGEKFYRELKQTGVGVRAGMEATGYTPWFGRLLARARFQDADWRCSGDLEDARPDAWCTCGADHESAAGGGHERRPAFSDETEAGRLVLRAKSLYKSPARPAQLEIWRQSGIRPLGASRSHHGKRQERRKTKSTNAEARRARRALARGPRRESACQRMYCRGACFRLCRRVSEFRPALR